MDAKTDPAQLTDQFPRIIADYLGSTFDPADTKFLLRPLASIHLHSHSGEELSANGNLMQLRFLGTMASLILILALLLHDPANAHIMYLRLGTGPIAPTLSFIQENFRKFSQNRFEHWFVKTTLTQQYAQEQTFTKVFSLFTLIAILIAFAGLYGLSRFMCERKTKEIGIRKILGASPLQVLWQILSHFFLLALIAFSLVIPFTAWSLKDWLSNFAYHIELDAKIFLLTLIAILLLSTLAVIYQVVKVAIQNPVKALRYE